MSRFIAPGLSLLLATALHIDWHLARPTHHHRLSFGWPYHWAATAVIFAAVAWLVARRWESSRWRVGTAVFVGALVLAQLVEPALEVAFYEGRVGYPNEPARWAAFLQTMLAATPAYFAALHWGRRSTLTEHAHA